ncbi:hypothetical protein Tco_1262853 [Tanacetum coccineum]
MDNHNITMDEYIRLQEEKALRHGRTPYHIGKLDLKNDTSFSKYDEEEQSVVYFNDLLLVYFIEFGYVRFNTLSWVLKGMVFTQYIAGGQCLVPQEQKASDYCDNLYPVLPPDINVVTSARIDVRFVTSWVEFLFSPLLENDSWMSDGEEIIRNVELDLVKYNHASVKLRRSGATSQELCMFALTSELVDKTIWHDDLKLNWGYGRTKKEKFKTVIIRNKARLVAKGGMFMVLARRCSFDREYRIRFRVLKESFVWIVKGKLPRAWYDEAIKLPDVPKDFSKGALTLTLEDRQSWDHGAMHNHFPAIQASLNGTYLFGVGETQSLSLTCHIYEIVDIEYKWQKCEAPLLRFPPLVRTLPLLPMRDQRHPYLRFEGLEYTDANIHTFVERLEWIFRRQIHRGQLLDFDGLTKELREDMDTRLRMVHSGEQGHDVFVSDAWRRDLVRRLCHRLIAHSIAGRGQAPEKVTMTDLYFLKSMDREAMNLLFLLAFYLFRHAEGGTGESGAYISGGYFIDAVASAPKEVKGAHDVDEGVQAISAPVQAPQPPPAAARSIPQRIMRLKDEARFFTWMISCITQLMDASGRTYQAFDSTLVESRLADAIRRILGFGMRGPCCNKIDELVMLYYGKRRVLNSNGHSDASSTHFFSRTQIGESSQQKYPGSFSF